MGQESGLSTWYYENGKVQKESENAYNEREGWTIDYDPQGRIICKRFFEHGNTVLVKGLAANGKDSLFFDAYKQSDSLTTYYDNGKPALSCRYEKGFLQGYYTKYFYDGNILEKANIDLDVANGKSTDHYANGKIMQQENYICNTQHGQQLSYYENGILQKDEGRYMGNLHGTMKAYNKLGALLVDAEYRHGMLVKNNLK
jgi:antitoxin component YwqK of YwqJK toxin-antitoxin module